MVEVASEQLTERERECVQHFREARERGVSFAEYCRAVGLKANEWHTVRHGMVRKGLLQAGGARAGSKKRSQPKRSRFIPVRVNTGSGTEISSSPVCRLRHASGWVIECAGLPELQWLKGLIGDAQP